MARYTDIDSLIEVVEETGWYHISKQGELVRGANSKVDIPLYKYSDIKEVLDDAPIADVVPKSEVEKLKDKYEIVYQPKAMIESNAKAEVAREIFEEIKSKKIFIKDHAGNMGVVVMLKDIAELKKKYTEEN